MNQQELFDLCADLFGGVFHDFKEMGLTAEQARNSSEKLVELFPIMKRLIESNLTYVTHIRKHPENQELLRWTGSGFLAAIANNPDLLTHEIMIRGAYRKCWNYFKENHAKDKKEYLRFSGLIKQYGQLIHNPIPDSGSIADRIEMSKEFDQFGKCDQKTVMNLLETKYDEYILEMMKSDDDMDLHIYHSFILCILDDKTGIVSNFAAANQDKFNFRKILAQFAYLIQTPAQYEKINLCAIGLFGFDLMKSKFIHNFICARGEYDYDYDFLYIFFPRDIQRRQDLFERMERLYNVSMDDLMAASRRNHVTPQPGDFDHDAQAFVPIQE